MKKFLSLILILNILLVFIAPLSVFASTSGTCGDNLTWTFNDGILTISGTGDMYDYGIVSGREFDYPWYSFRSSIKEVHIEDGVTCVGIDAFYLCSTVENVYLGKDIKAIKSAAFAHCKSLRSITFPDSVKTIAGSSFYECTSLRTVVLGNGVETIESEAFAYCNLLQEIKIPDSVTKLGIGAFRECHYLSYAVIGSGLTQIPENCFYYCDRLTDVVIYDNIVSVDECAFLNCINLSDVYYTADETSWNNILISSFNEPLKNATVHYTDYILPNQISGSFNYSSGTGTSTYSYSDSFFENPAQTYNHDLSKMSMKLALSAFASEDGSNKYQNAESLLSDLDFNAIDYNYAYTVEPDTDSIGVIVGKKHIAYSDGDYTLLAVTLRGGGYKDEWYGNFRVGNDNIHEGFNLAKGQVVDFLTNYVKEKEIIGKVKIWITGYSRAGATANLAAAYLNENPNCLSNRITLSTDNIFAYCFEPPAGVKNPNNESGLYNNIFNIVNQHDFVPMVAMRNWGFERYGITKYLPTAYTNKNYTGLFV